jgi:hypothetical protein
MLACAHARRQSLGRAATISTLNNDAPQYAAEQRTRQSVPPALKRRSVSQGHSLPDRPAAAARTPLVPFSLQLTSHTTTVFSAPWGWTGADQSQLQTVRPIQSTADHRLLITRQPLPPPVHQVITTLKRLTNSAMDPLDRARGLLVLLQSLSRDADLANVVLKSVDVRSRVAICLSALKLFLSPVRCVVLSRLFLCSSY